MTSIFAQALAGGPNPFAAHASPNPVSPATPSVANEPAVNNPAVNEPAVNEPAVSKPAAIEPVKPAYIPPKVDEGAKDGYDQKSSKY
jgi:hypothetical protein